MLYNPQWEKPSVAGFRAWLEQQDPNETFDYDDRCRCAVGQYLAAMGTDWVGAGEMAIGLNAFACAAVLNTSRKTTFRAVLNEIKRIAG